MNISVPMTASVERSGWCAICRAGVSAQVNAAKAAGATYREMAKTFGLSVGSVFRHLQQCPAGLNSQLNAQAEAYDPSALGISLDQLVQQWAESLDRLKADAQFLRENDDRRGAVAAEKSLASSLGDLLGRVADASERRKLEGQLELARMEIEVEQERRKAEPANKPKSKVSILDLIAPPVGTEEPPEAIEKRNKLAEQYALDTKNDGVDPLA